MPVALVWVTAPAEACTTKDLNYSEIQQHGGRFRPSFLGSNITRKLSAQTNVRKLRVNFCAGKAALEVSSSKPTLENSSIFPSSSSVVTDPSGKPVLSSEQKVYDVVLKQAAMVDRQVKGDALLDVKPDLVPPGTLQVLNEAYDRCGEVCAEYAKTFYLGTLLMTPERRKAIWAIYGTPYIASKSHGTTHLEMFPSGFEKWTLAGIVLVFIPLLAEILHGFGSVPNNEILHSFWFSK